MKRTKDQDFKKVTRTLRIQETKTLYLKYRTSGIKTKQRQDVTSRAVSLRFSSPEKNQSINQSISESNKCRLIGLEKGGLKMFTSTEAALHQIQQLPDPFPHLEELDITKKQL